MHIQLRSRPTPVLALPRWCALLAALLTSVLAFPALADDAPQTRERWYVVQLGGQRAGYMQATERFLRDRILTSSTMVLKIKRDQSSIELRFTSEFVESSNHKPLLMRSEQRIAKLPDVVEYVFRDNDVEITRGIGAQRSVEAKPLPAGQWLTPAAARREVAKAMAEGTSTIVTRTIDPLLGLDPITTTRTVEERTTARAAGREVPAIRWSSATDKYPDVKSTEFVDVEGELISADTKIGGLQLTLLLADRDLALAAVDPPELLNSTMIRPDKPIAEPRQLSRATYIVTSRGDKLAPLPTAGAQTSERIDAQSARVKVEANGRTAATAEDLADPDFRKPSAMISSEDPEVVKLKDQGVPGEVKDRPPFVRAQALRRTVFSTIKKKNLDVGFASAAETARTRAGDCTEHAVLLAALLRADGIPSRVVSGLIYVEPPPGDAKAAGMFGYHMWTQALIQEGDVAQWVDLDPTLPVGTTFDAAHIALLTSSMSDKAMGNDLVRLAPLIGTLEITVERAESDRETKDARPAPRGTKRDR